MEKIKLYNLALFWTYFNNGYSFMSLPKWIAMLFGLDQLIQYKNYWLVAFGCIFYFGFCIFLGRLIIKSGFLEALNEVMNRNNRFMKEVRSSKLFKDKNS